MTQHYWKPTSPDTQAVLVETSENEDTTFLGIIHFQDFPPFLVEILDFLEGKWPNTFCWNFDSLSTKFSDHDLVTTLLRGFLSNWMIIIDYQAHVGRTIGISA